MWNFENRCGVVGRFYSAPSGIGSDCGGGDYLVRFVEGHEREKGSFYEIMYAYNHLSVCGCRRLDCRDLRRHRRQFLMETGIRSLKTVNP